MYLISRYVAKSVMKKARNMGLLILQKEGTPFLLAIDRNKSPLRSYADQSQTFAIGMIVKLIWVLVVLSFERADAGSSARFRLQLR